MSTYYYGASRSSYLSHHGIKGQRWGIRRYQNADGTLTEAGLKRRQKLEYKIEKTKAKAAIAQNKASSSKSKYENASYKKQKSALKKAEKAEKEAKKEAKKQQKKDEKEAERNAGAKKVQDFLKSDTGKKLLNTSLEVLATKYISGKTDADASSALYILSKAFAPNAKNTTEKAQAAAQKQRDDQKKYASDAADYWKNAVSAAENQWKYNTKWYIKNPTNPNTKQKNGGGNP